MAGWLGRDQYTRFAGDTLLSGLRADFEASLGEVASAPTVVPGAGFDPSNIAAPPLPPPPPMTDTPVQPVLPAPTEQTAPQVGSGLDEVQPGLPPQPRIADSAIQGSQSTLNTPSSVNYGTDWQKLAESQIGKPYIWGSAGGRSDFNTNAAGFDCSGFVSFVYKNALGINLPAQTASAYAATRSISQADARPGDIVEFNMGSNDPHQQHIAIYLGDGKIIQAGGNRHDVNVGRVDQFGSGTFEFRRADGADTAKGNATAARAVVAKVDDIATPASNNILDTLRQGFEDTLNVGVKTGSDVLERLRGGFESAMSGAGQGLLDQGTQDRKTVSQVGNAVAGIPESVGTSLLDQGQQDRETLAMANDVRKTVVGPSAFEPGHPSDTTSILLDKYGTIIPSDKMTPDDQAQARNVMLTVGGATTPLSTPAVTKTASKLLDDVYKMHADQAKVKLPEINLADIGKSVETALTDKFAALNKLSPEVEESSALFQGRTGAAMQQSKEAFAPVYKAAGKNLPDLDAFVKLQHDAEVAVAKGGTRTASAGVTSTADAQAALVELEQRLGPKTWAKVKQADQLRQDILDNLLTAKVTEGLVKPEIADLLQTQYPHYNPVKFVNVAEQGLLGTGKSMSQNVNTLKRLGVIGHTADTLPPMQSAISAFVQGTVAIQRNQVARDIAESVVAQGLGKRASSIALKTGMDIKTGEAATIATRITGQRPGHISYWEGGKRVDVSVPRDIEVAATALTDTGMNKFQQIASRLNAPLRAGAVTLNTQFLIKNPIGDAITTFITEGFEATARIPQGMAQRAFNTKTWREYVKAGGSAEGFNMSSPATVEKAIQQSGGTVIKTKEQWANLVKNVVTSPVRGIKELGAIAEAGPHVATYSTHLRRGESVPASVMAGRRVTVDFARSGSWIKAANPAIPFLNATVQGSLQLARPLGLNVAKTLLKPTSAQLAARLRLAGVAAVATSLWAHNREFKEEWADIPDYIKDQYAVVILGPGEKNENGVGFKSIPYIALPLRQYALPSAIITHAMAAGDEADPRSWGDFIKSAGMSFSPISGDSVAAGIGGLIPAPGKAVLESAANRKFFTNSPIVGGQLEGTSPSEQYDEHTGMVAKELGQRFNRSPKGIEAAATTIGGGLARQISTLDFNPLKAVVRDQGGQTLEHKYDRAADIMRDERGPSATQTIQARKDYQTSNRDRQVALDKVGQLEAKTETNRELGIPKTATDTGLPQKYVGVTDPKQAEIIDEARAAYHAWLADPKNATKPTLDQRRLALRYDDRVRQQYLRAVKVDQSENASARADVRRNLPPIKP